MNTVTMMRTVKALPTTSAAYVAEAVNKTQQPLFYQQSQLELQQKLHSEPRLKHQGCYSVALTLLLSTLLLLLSMSFHSHFHHHNSLHHRLTVTNTTTLLLTTCAGEPNRSANTETSSNILTA